MQVGAARAVDRRPRVAGYVWTSQPAAASARRGPRVALGHDDDAGPDREDVAAERRELLLGHLDQPDPEVAAAAAHSPTGSSGRNTTARSSATGEMTDIRWISSAGPCQYGTSKIADVAADERGELAGAGVVGPQRPPDAEQVGPEPERVAALDRAGASIRPSVGMPAARVHASSDGGLAARGSACPGRSGIAPRSVTSSGSKV